MCGRYQRRADKQRIAEAFALGDMDGITVEPNDLVSETTHHDRMPLIVEKRDWQRWLEPSVPEQPPIDLLRPFDANQMKAWRSDTAIMRERSFRSQFF